MSDSDNTSEKHSFPKLFISSEHRPQSLERYIRNGWAVARVLEAWAAMEEENDNSPQPLLTLREGELQNE